MDTIQWYPGHMTRAKRMMQENYEAWKKCYEETYGKMLIYDTEAK